jgi:hypothetical protein
MLKALEDFVDLDLGLNAEDRRERREELAGSEV